jgi:hypothetical protein
VGIEIPRSIHCQTSGGSRLKMHKNLKFNADSEYQINIPIHYFGISKFKIRKPWGILTVQRKPITEDLGEWKDEAGSREKKTDYLAERMIKLAQEEKIKVFDSNEHIKTCVGDGVHLSAQSNIVLGKKLAEYLLGLPGFSS